MDPAEPATEPAPDVVPPGWHRHDNYWGDDVEVTLFDGREQHTHGCEETLASTSQGGSVKFAFPRGQLVHPGTSDLEANCRLEAATITRLRLLYRPASEHDFVDAALKASSQAEIS